MTTPQKVLKTELENAYGNQQKTIDDYSKWLSDNQNNQGSPGYIEDQNQYLLNIEKAAVDRTTAAFSYSNASDSQNFSGFYDQASNQVSVDALKATRNNLTSRYEIVAGMAKEQGMTPEYSAELSQLASEIDSTEQKISITSSLTSQANDSFSSIIRQSIDTDLEKLEKIDLGNQTLDLPNSTSRSTNAPTTTSEPQVVDEIVVTAKISKDHRIRLRPKPAVAENLYTGLLKILEETRGFMFPYTPRISYAGGANYTQMTPTHSNQEYFFYQNTPSLEISISGEWTAQNSREAEYWLACKHFLHTIRNMRFGKSSNPGFPPPMLILSGYGAYMFNDIPVILKDFSVELNPDVDMIDCVYQGSRMRVPTLSTFSLRLQVQQTPTKQRSFDWDKFASGELLKSKGWI